MTTCVQETNYNKEPEIKSNNGGCHKLPGPIETEQPGPATGSCFTISLRQTSKEVTYGAPRNSVTIAGGLLYVLTYSVDICMVGCFQHAEYLSCRFISLLEVRGLQVHNYLILNLI